MDSLLFVYNADGGMTNALLDTGRRIFRPSQYPCALCMVTYGPFGMKADWKKFTDSLPYIVSFMHKDELPEKFQTMNLNFPCVLLEDSQTTILLNTTDFESIHDLATLKDVVTAKLETRSAPTA